MTDIGSPPGARWRSSPTSVTSCTSRPPRRLRNGLRHGPSRGSLVQAEVRTVDNVARFGGEEFVVLLRETGVGSAFLLAERLRQQISGGAIEARGKKIVSVTASVRDDAGFGIDPDPSPRSKDSELRTNQNKDNGMAEKKVYQVADWNGQSGERWVANQARLDAMAAVFGQAAIEA
ncbi:diguanylate cyclase, partial [Bradyrhizobium sp. PRIMUS42]